MKCDKCVSRCNNCHERLTSAEEPYLELQPIQIIPAPGWRAVFSGVDGAKDVHHPLVAWGLTEGGSVLPLAMIDPDGSATDPRDEGDFLRIEYVGHLTGATKP